jgi:hypothetical protein
VVVEVDTGKILEGCGAGGEMSKNFMRKRLPETDPITDEQRDYWVKEFQTIIKEIAKKEQEYDCPIHGKCGGTDGECSCELEKHYDPYWWMKITEVPFTTA